MLNVFKDILGNKKNYLRANTGRDFEDRFEDRLRKSGYSQILSTDLTTQELRDLKVFLVKKDSTEHLKFNLHSKSFLRAPFGSQNYPDFLIFTGKYAVPIEIKYSKESQTHPVWNSGIPRANGIYIFGSYKKQDITFFLGGDVLNDDRRKALIGFFEIMKSEEAKFKKRAKADILDSEKRGFMPYVRRAYEQKKNNKDTEINYFVHPDRKTTEENVLKTLSYLL